MPLAVRRRSVRGRDVRGQSLRTIAIGGGDCGVAGSEATAKKSSVLLTLDAEPSAAPARGQPDRHVGAAC